MNDSMGLLGLSRTALLRIAKIQFEQSWQFSMHIESTNKTQTEITLPKNFDLFIKDISFGATEVTTETAKVGATVFTQPQSAEPVVLAMTVRDTHEKIVANWFDSLVGRVVNPDGTLNVPFDYLVDVTIYSRNPDTGEEIEMHKWTMIPLKRDTKTYDLTANTGFVETPISLTQYRSLG